MADSIRTVRAGIETIHQTVEATLDALTAGTLSPDDLAWDAQRGKWVPVRDHFALTDAWFERQRFRPAKDRQPLSALPQIPAAFPSLTDGGTTPVQGVPSAKPAPPRAEAFQPATEQPGATAERFYARGEQALIWAAVAGLGLLLVGALVAFWGLLRGITGLTR